jgi:hypothetical protein
MFALQVKEKKGVSVQPDDAIPFGQLASRTGPGAEKEDVFELSLTRAVGGASKREGYDPQSTKLSKVRSWGYRILPVTAFFSPSVVLFIIAVREKILQFGTRFCCRSRS